MNSKPNILILTSRFPFPLEKGDKLRMYNQIKDLSKENNIFLFSMSDEKVSLENQNQLKEFVVDFHIEYINKYTQLFTGLFKKKPFQVSYFYKRKSQIKLDSLVKEWEIEKIYCQLIRMSEYVNNYTHFKVLDYMDSFSLGLKRRITESSLITKPIYKLEYKRVKAYEIEQSQKFDKLFIIAENDRKSIKTQKSIELLKNGVDFTHFHPDKKGEKSYDLVFVGNMQYHPNVKAVKFLVNSILPLLEEKGFNLSVLIAGANPTLEVQKLASENITVSGWLDDIREAYWGSKIFIAPLFTGSGLQNKVLEAMASKIPVITTSIVNHSLGAKKDEMIYIANTPEDFVNSVLFLLDENNKLQVQDTISKANNFIINTYGWSNNNDKLLKSFK